LQGHRNGARGAGNVLEKIVARIPVGRLGEASEIAGSVVFLIADDAGFITGSTLSINGGQHMY
jgi:acetoacetyl-CoA reductase